jgi:hypothetical protein
VLDVAESCLLNLECTNKSFPSKKLTFYDVFAVICEHKADDCFAQAHTLEENKKQLSEGEKYDRSVLAESTKAMKWLTKKELCEQERTQDKTPKKGKKSTTSSDSTTRADVLHSFWNKEKLVL